MIPEKPEAKATNQSDLRQQNHLLICEFLIIVIVLKKHSDGKGYKNNFPGRAKTQ